MRAVLALGVVVALAGAAPSVALAQDSGAPRHRHCPTCGADLGAERCPTCGQAKGLSDEDRELERALRREYGDPNGPAPRRIQTPPPEPIPPPPPPPPPRRVTSDDDERDFYVHMGVLGAHWAARLSSVSISSAKYGNHGDYVGLSGGKGSAGDLDDWSQTQLFRAWIDLGPWFSFDGGANRSWFRSTGPSTRDFVFKGQQFGNGQVLETKFDSLVADFNFVVHPIHGVLGHLDILFGLRYMWSSAELRAGNPGPGPIPGPPIIMVSTGGVPFIPGGFGGFTAPANTIPGFRAKQTTEAIIPMIGIGGTLRPIHTKEVTVEIFGRARTGGFQWDERGYSYRRDRWIDRSFLAYSVELDGGVSATFFEVLGVTAGYHFDLGYIEREDHNETERADWRAHGPYGGVFVQF